jgi:hypothetical protein
MLNIFKYLNYLLILWLFLLHTFLYYTVGIKDPLVPKTNKKETEKILTRQFLLLKRVQACTHFSWAQNGWQWLLLISLTQLYLPLTWDLSRSKVHSLSRIAKRLRGWVRAYNLVGNFHGQWECPRIQKKQEPFKQLKSPKMATWGILRDDIYFDRKDCFSYIHKLLNMPFFLPFLSFPTVDTVAFISFSCYILKVNIF